MTTPTNREEREQAWLASLDAAVDQWSRPSPSDTLLIAGVQRRLRHQRRWRVALLSIAIALAAMVVAPPLWAVASKLAATLPTHLVAVDWSALTLLQVLASIPLYVWATLALLSGFLAVATAER